MKHLFITSTQQEQLNRHDHNFVCWKSVIAGLLISIMSYLLLSALGAGIGGLTAVHLINNEENGTGLATAAGLWMGISAVISLFLGSYFALRISKFVTNRVGAAHAFLIASLFFILMAWGLGSVVGGASRGVGHLLGNLSTNSTILANSPSVQDTINQAIGSHSLKSSPSEVAKELSVRLIKGDSESAKRYYAYQTGLSDAEANTKVEQMKNDFEAALRQAGEVAAKAMAAAGWTLFVIFLLGLIAAVLGGRLGAHANLERPIVRYTTLDETGSALPYVLGWFMGVPISVLFLIFALRSC
jgi:hypothetical protein